MIPIRVKINGQWTEAEVAPRTHLADFLREERLLTGTHIGCEHGICGACTVEMDGQIVRGCLTYAVVADGAEIRTIEGFEADPLMARLREAFSEHHALQCGYCTPGMLVTARDLIRRGGDLSRAEIRLAMSGNLCRCTGYVGIIDAIAEVMSEGDRWRADGEAQRPLGPAPGPEAPDAAELSEAVIAGETHAPPALPDPGNIEAVDRAGLTQVTESFVMSFPRDAVWAHMADVARLAEAMPGAVLDAPPADGRFQGRIAVKIGPIGASFAGQGRHARAPESFSGLIDGTGRDGGSGSLARGCIDYRLEALPDDRTRIDVELGYALAGPLAQFGRAGLVKDIVTRLGTQFVQNLERQLSGEVLPSDRPDRLDAFGLVAAVLKARLVAVFRRVFGR